jgi:hypothetical protein
MRALKDKKVKNRKGSEIELLDIEKLNEIIIKKSPIGIHIVERNFTVRVWNAYFENYTTIKKNKKITLLTKISLKSSRD